MRCEMLLPEQWERHASAVALSFSACVSVQADPGKLVVELQAPDGQHDGQHDFDFSFGIWKTHISRRLHPLTGSNW
jgi:hypothetical protein